MLRVPEVHAGKKAKCPHCQSVAEVPSVQAAPASSYLEPLKDPSVSPTNPYASDPKATASNPYLSSAAGSNPYGAPATTQRPRYREAHRGGTILTLGILSFVCNIFLIPGIMAWVMGNSDLKKMKQGVMDDSGHGMTMAGMILGILTTVVPIAILILYVLLVIVLVIAGVAAN